MRPTCTEALRSFRTLTARTSIPFSVCMRPLSFVASQSNTSSVSHGSERGFRSNGDREVNRGAREANESSAAPCCSTRWPPRQKAATGADDIPTKTVSDTFLGRLLTVERFFFPRHLRNYGMMLHRNPPTSLPVTDLHRAAGGLVA